MTWPAWDSLRDSLMRASSDLGLMMPEIHLFHSVRKFERFCKRSFGEKVETHGTEGQMTYCDGVAVVLMTYSGNETTELSLLVHEAYHVAVHHMDYLGEDEAGEETMAYLIQSVTHALFTAHGRWKRKRQLLS